jgi:hypothetical protein
MWLIPSVTAFLTSVLLHAVAIRLAERAGVVAAFVVIAAVIGLALIVYCAGSYGLTPATLAATLSYAFACELYIFLFTLVGNSVSFGLLSKLAGHPLEGAEIAAFDRAEAMVARRFEQLERANLIAPGPAGFRLTARSERVVRIFSFLHILFGRQNRWVSSPGGGDDAA